VTFSVAQYNKVGERRKEKKTPLKELLLKNIKYILIMKGN